ncbi:hypothetical protein ACL9Z5_001353 [Acinetobacter calcoaceticus]
MSKIRTYQAEFIDGTFIFNPLPYDKNNFPNSGYESLKGKFQPIRVKSKTDEVFIFASTDLHEHEVKKLKDDWEISDINF